MSNPTMNHTGHMHHHHQQQQQQQQQQINEVQPTHSNLVNSTPMTLTRSDSSSTMILEEEETRAPRRTRLDNLPPSVLANLSVSLRSLLKTSGLFNDDLQSSDKLSDLFASGDGFTLQRLLSEIDTNDINFDMNDLFKLDSRTLSEFIRSESFDLISASTGPMIDNLSLTPLALPCSSSSFSELRPVSPELITHQMLPDQSRMDTDNSFAPPTTSQQFNFNQGTLDAVEHDHAFLCKRGPAADAPSPSARRSSSRLQARTTNVSSPTSGKRTRNINRAKDVETSDDLSYYLERRRKNNEASKVSRASRKQKFDNMDERCEEYERVNTELRTKISTLETVTAILKSGLVNNFHRKNDESKY